MAQPVPFAARHGRTAPLDDKLVLVDAEFVRATDRATLLRLRTVHGTDLPQVWFPNTHVEFVEDRWLATPWIVRQKDATISGKISVVGAAQFDAGRFVGAALAQVASGQATFSPEERLLMIDALRGRAFDYRDESTLCANCGDPKGEELALAKAAAFDALRAKLEG